jgi:hypothetical protein
MREPAVLAFLLFCALIAQGQSVKRSAGKKVPGTDRPTCSPGAICFSGKVLEGEEFRKTLNPELEFVLKRGWTITIASKQPEGDCQELASVVNPPYRAHRDLDLDTSYGWTAEEAVAASPREFRFVTNCSDYRTESERLSVVLWPYTATQQKVDEALAKLGTSPSGRGRLWITDSRTSHTGDTPDEKLGKIEWRTFTVEITLPRL